MDAPNFTESPIEVAIMIGITCVVMIIVVADMVSHLREELAIRKATKRLMSARCDD